MYFEYIDITSFTLEVNNQAPCWTAKCTCASTNTSAFATRCIANRTFLRQNNKAVSITSININYCTTINETDTESNNNTQQHNATRRSVQGYGKHITHAQCTVHKCQPLTYQLNTRHQYQPAHKILNGIKPFWQPFLTNDMLHRFLPQPDWLIDWVKI